jgi:hypothetical protein
LCACERACITIKIREEKGAMVEVEVEVEVEEEKEEV